MKKRCLVLFAVLFISAGMAGCGNNAASELVEIPKDMYQKTEYQTVQAIRGDMQPTLALKLKPMNVETIDYSVDENNLIVEEVYVNAGDYVKAGQTLISFKSDEIRKNIEKYNSEVARKQLLLDHYVRMYNAETSKDKDEQYGVILQELTDDVELAKLFLAEEQQRFNKCQVVASQDGVVSFLSKGVLSGYAEAGQTLITEACGRNQFSATTKDNYEFHLGDTFMADFQDDSYDMAVVDIIEEEAGSRTIVFEPVYVVLNVSAFDVLDMTIEKPALSNVVYVDKHAVYTKDEKSFVYVVNENGFLDAVYVEAGVEENGMVAIHKGLEGTEKVAIK